MATLLVFTVLLPLVTSLALFLSPSLDVRTSRSIALGTTGVTVFFSLVFLLAFRIDVTTPQFAFGAPSGPYGLGWLDRTGIRFALGLDGVSVWLFGLTTLLMIT